MTWTPHTYYNTDVRQGEYHEMPFVLRKDKEAKGRVYPKKKISTFALVFGGVLDIGFSIALPMAGGALLGVYLDRRFHTTPVLTLALLFGGLGIGLYSVYRIITRLIEN